MPDPRDTPAMQQHARFKRQHPDCVLLFRIGDFYEMFDDDAVNVSKAIGLTLTQRTAGIPMAGMPHHQLDTYLRKLIHAGFRVAVCEQLEDASKSKGIVARGITRVITPGTLVDESLLEEGSPATVAAVSFCESGDESAAALAVIDLSTGAFHLSSGSQASVQADLIRRGVKELLYADHLNGQPPPRVKATMAGITLAAVPRPTWQFRTVEALDVLHKHFAVSTLAGFGLHQDDPALPAAGALLAFLIETQTAAASQTAPDAAGSTAASGLALRATLSHLRPPTRETDSGACILDAVSLRSLEIERTIRANTEEGSLLALFKGKHGFRTQMGRRQIREWLLRPLGNTAAIRSRQSAVAALAENRIMAGDLRDRLSGVQDVAQSPDASRSIGRHRAIFWVLPIHSPGHRRSRPASPMLRTLWFNNRPSRNSYPRSNHSPPASLIPSSPAHPPTPERAASSKTPSTPNWMNAASSSATAARGSQSISKT